MPAPPNYSSYHHADKFNANQYRVDSITSGRTSPQHHPLPSTVPTPESLALSRLRATSISHPLQQCQITIYVKNPGAVIGRGGRTILNVQKEAMRLSLGHTGSVRISVLGGNSTNNSSTNPSNDATVNAEEASEFLPSSQGGATWNYHEYHSSVHKAEEENAEPSEEDDYVPVIIRGDPVGCFAATRQIMHLVHQKHDPDIVFEVPIHRSKHSLLVGKEGLIVAALSAEYDVRVMVPPSDLTRSSTVHGPNYWQSNQYGAETGPARLFSDTMTNNINPGGEQTSTLPLNVIQLEGHINKCETCLIKMLSIVAGEEWVPPGVIVHSGKENEQSNEQSTANNDPKLDNDSTSAKAFAIITTNIDSPNIGGNKLRTIIRKTNTLIRRKKGRFYLKGVEYGYNEEEGAEESLVNEDDDLREDDDDDDGAAANANVSISFLISGKIENVKLASKQIEQLLGLDTNSAVVIMKEGSPTANAADGPDDRAEKKKRNQRVKRDRAKRKNQKELSQEGKKVDDD